MIGYYVHHQGSGHLRRALAISHEFEPGHITALSSLPLPNGWRGDWVQLDRDDLAESPVDPSALGQLHWVPRNDEGLRRRMARISAWIEEAAPSAFVSDVSVEVAVLARLHGVPVVSVVLPGIRDDPPHAFGFGVSDAIIAAWPPAAARMWHPASEFLTDRLHEVGAISNIRPLPGRPPGPIARVLVLGGSGGGGMTATQLADAREQTPGVKWTELGTHSGNRVDDPIQHLRESDLVISHAGQGAIADVSSAGVPAILVPQPRPHQEQATTGEALALMKSLPVIVLPDFSRSNWRQILDDAEKLDGRQWSQWNDGNGAGRAAAVIKEVARQ